MTGTVALDDAIGLRLVESSSGRATFALDPTAVATVDGTPPFLHGGALAAAVDSAAWQAAVSTGGDWVPAGFRIDFLRPARPERLRVEATVRRAGRSLAVVDVEISRADGEPVALGRVTLARVGQQAHPGPA